MASVRFYELLKDGYGHRSPTLPTDMVVDFQKVRLKAIYFVNETVSNRC